MSGVPSVSITEARGAIALPADLDQTAIVVGCSSAGSGLSSFYSSTTTAIAGRGYGDGPDVLTQIIARTQKPTAMYTVPEDAPGTYGTINNASMTGTCVPAVSASTPLGTYEAGVKFVTGGTVGTAGITYRTTLDNGRNWSRLYALGTAGSISIANSGVGFELNPPSAALYTLLNEIKTDFNAHVILTAGSVHGAADNADVVATADATTIATAIALANALRAAYELHRVKTSSSIHGAADNTNAITAPVATDGASCVTLANDLKAKYNLHRVVIAASVHGAADSTNVTSAADAAQGTIVANDATYVRTFAPTFASTDLDDALTALKNNSVEFALLFVVGPISATMAEHIKTGVAALRTVGKRVTAIFSTRLPDFEASETADAWKTSIEADYASFEDSSCCVRAAYGLITDAVTSRQYLRSDLAQFAADVVRVPRVTWPCAPADRAMEGVYLADADGDLVGHDEGPMGEATGLSDDDQGQRFSCDFRAPEPAFRTSTFTTVPWVMYAADERIKNLMVRRVSNAIERVASAVSFAQLGGTTFYTPASAGSPAQLTETGRNRIHAKLYNAIASTFQADIQNADASDPDTGLVQVASTVTISGGNLVTADVTIAPLVLGYLLSINVTVAIQE